VKNEEGEKLYLSVYLVLSYGIVLAVHMGGVIYGVGKAMLSAPATVD
jgi:hypothetical protein